jgi:hypothetical protein
MEVEEGKKNKKEEEEEEELSFSLKMAQLLPKHVGAIT